MGKLFAPRSDDRMWAALEDMRIEPDGAALTFEAKLAHENGWTLAFAKAVTVEYKKFLYLAAMGSKQVTPSDEVDQAWHLHLSYSRHYWDVLCGKILNRPLHHGPTAGGTAEQNRYRLQYRETLHLYRDIFGTEPPPRIWPGVAERFSSRSRRIDTAKYWAVPKSLPKTAAILGAAGVAAACTVIGNDGGSGDAGGERLAALLIVLVLAAAGFWLLLKLSQRSRPDSKDGSCGGGGCGGSFGSGDSNSDGGSSGCGGGCGGD